MKKLKKNIILIVTIICLISLSATAYAYELLGDGEISGGIDGLQYWRDSSIYEYKDSLAYGVQAWDGVTSEISVTRTTTKSYSQADCYWGAYFPSTSGIIAECELYINSTRVYNFDNNWYWCKLKFSSYEYNYSELDYLHRKGVACHEFGHFLGLWHNETSTSNIMYPYGNLCSVAVPSTDDINGVKAIYGP